VNAGAMIVNLSLGGEGDSRFLHNTIRSAHDQGVVFVAAAGNQPVTTPTYPAAYPEVLAITATDRNGQLASYANRGDFVDLAAPGGSLVTFNGQQFFVVGTSAATASVSGRAASVMEQSGTTGRDVERRLFQQTTPTATPAPAKK
jgi:thermitase